MFYIIDEKFKVVSKVFKEEDIEKMVVNYMKALTKQNTDPSETKDWCACEDGYYYLKNEEFILRKYTTYKGYVYNSSHYETLCCLRVSDYNG